MTHFSFVPRRAFRGLWRAAVPRCSYVFALTFLFATFAATCSVGQTPPSQLALSDPLNAATKVPVVHYESSFAHYRPLGDTRVAPWRFSNDTAERRGGWRAYAREAAAPDAATVAVKPASVQTSTTPPATVVAPAKTTSGGSHAHAPQ